MHPSWQPFLKKEFNSPYFQDLATFLSAAYTTKTIYPPKPQVFSAFTTDLNQIKVVILGQDPYHGPGQAHGLAFSVRPNIPTPPSLINIFKEIESDLGHPIDQSPHLKRWADQGVLLLNNVLTVEAHRPTSHSHKGWETFTESAIKHLSNHRKHLVFLLWGRPARAKSTLIDATKHLILEAPHPSPLSANYGFFGCKHFSKANAYLTAHKTTPINW
jgi:uracil-DNA glycosylase